MRRFDNALFTRGVDVGGKSRKQKKAEKRTEGAWQEINGNGVQWFFPIWLRSEKHRV